MNKSETNTKQSALKRERSVAYGAACLAAPHISAILENSDNVLANVGSCLAGPNGEWIVEPVADEEKLIVATLDHKRVREGRQNFDPTGHYSRPNGGVN